VQVKAGMRLRSVVCATEVIVVKAPATDVDLRCGGQALIAMGATVPGGSADPDFAEGTKMGKRYSDSEGTLELLCTKPGMGSLSLGTEIIAVKDAKALPSSD
jgi:hypothetical protein